MSKHARLIPFFFSKKKKKALFCLAYLFLTRGRNGQRSAGMELINRGNISFPSPYTKTFQANVKGAMSAIFNNILKRPKKHTIASKET